LPSTAEQLEVLVLLLQLTVPPFQQFAEAVQRDFGLMVGRRAASSGAGVPAETLAREARNA